MKINLTNMGHNNYNNSSIGQEALFLFFFEKEEWEVVQMKIKFVYIGNKLLKFTVKWCRQGGSTAETH